MDSDDEEHLEVADQREESSISRTLVARTTSGAEPGPSNLGIYASSSRTHARLVTSPEQHAPSEPHEISQQICPVCSKTLETDNQGLNTHIDFCLSRGAIKEAHAEAASAVKSKNKTRPPDLGLVWSGGGKPKSTTKLKDKHE
jgi:DNA polymerase kappa